jgi:hypothetical protein
MAMARTLAASLLLAALTTVATAQRGGGGHAGGGGARVAPGFHSGYSAPSTFAPRAAAPAAYRGPVAAPRPGFYQNHRGIRPVYGNRGVAVLGYGYSPYAYGYDYPGWIDTTDTPAPVPYADTAPAQPADDPSAGYPLGYQQMAAGQPQPAAPQPPPAPAAATTILFKDGRPPEQVHSYMATHFTLTVFQGQRHFDIPIDDIDIAATRKANSAAGIDFQLP